MLICFVALGLKAVKLVVLRPTKVGRWSIKKDKWMWEEEDTGKIGVPVSVREVVSSNHICSTLKVPDSTLDLVNPGDHTLPYLKLRHGYLHASNAMM